MLTPRQLPPELTPLAEMALDLRWTWSHAGDALWRALDATLWDQTRNPWFVLENVPSHRLDELAREPAFMQELQRLTSERRTHLESQTWYAADGARLHGASVAYFSMEFGLGEAVPLYAGGLGILAGDYLKAASDLGLPLVGVGILFQEGYFRQIIDAAGIQHEVYPYNDPSTMPIQPARGADGGWVRITLTLPGRNLWLRVWRASIGRISLYLLDANDPLNSAADRGITNKLYEWNTETRLFQEMVLGIGGWRMLETLGIGASIAHLNEGHAAFAVIERARLFMQREHLSFREALWATRAGNVFTTHTPVAAGFDRYSVEFGGKYINFLNAYTAELGIPIAELLGLGRRDPTDPREAFNLAYLAMRGCAFFNAVSRRHGEVSRRIFRELFPRWPEREVPVEHITNGVHVPSWDSRAADELWTRSCGKDRWLGPVERLQEAVCALSDEDLWALRSEERRGLVTFARARLERQLQQRGGSDAAASVARLALDPNALTLGFARRFADYKRPLLLLRDPERLARLLNSVDRPVQLIVAGKAHPADHAGKRMITEWMKFAGRMDVRHRVVFLEDYDITIAEALLRGVDVWINTPRPPWEACGTSGMKTLVNGGLNLSQLDGWWAEAYTPEVGWAIGGDALAPSDQRDAEQLYGLLEREVVPEFYDRDAVGIARRWVARIRASMSRLAPAFSANRMAREYLERVYVPAASLLHRRTGRGGELAKELHVWQQMLQTHWHQVRFGEVAVAAREGGWYFSATVHLGEILADWVRAELYAEPLSGEAPERVKMEPVRKLVGDVSSVVYEVVVTTGRPAQDYTPRIVPHHAGARIPAELPLVVWQR